MLEISPFSGPIFENQSQSQSVSESQNVFFWHFELWHHISKLFILSPFEVGISTIKYGQSVNEGNSKTTKRIFQEICKRMI